MIYNDLVNLGLCTFPKELKSNVHYETMMGSVAYGASTDKSDLDVYAWYIPPKEQIFPHLGGHIYGLGPKPQYVDQFQSHHIAGHPKYPEIDYTCYSITNYFHLCAGCNPNMLDSLFAPQHCVMHCTVLAKHVRDNKEVFLCKKAYHTFTGYAYAQRNSLLSKNPVGKRKETIEKYGYDVKLMSHAVRLILECQDILEKSTIEIGQHGELLKFIKTGGWSLDAFNAFFEEKEKLLKQIDNLEKLSQFFEYLNKTQPKGIVG